MTTFLDEENEEKQTYDFALPGKRIFVVLIEIINCWVLTYIARFMFPNVYDRPLYIGCITILLAYKIIAEKTGWQSFGKKMYKLEVLSVDGTAPGWDKIMRRNIFWLLLPVFYAVYFYILIPNFGEAFRELPPIFSLINVRDAFKVCLLIVAADIGFVFFTPKRQALHDLLGDTIVIDRN